MEIEIKNTELKDVWDIERAKKVLEIMGLSEKGIKGLTPEQKEYFEKEITQYLWKKMKKQFPKIEKFCNEKAGGFNRCEEKQYNTPIINVLGDFYIQLVCENSGKGWICEKVSLEPYRFEFNEEGYLKNLIVEAINKAITSGEATKETFKDLISALNETPTKQKEILMETKGENVGRTHLIERDTKIK